ncbi:MAG: TetR/AcrR family transcriptional regulator [Methanobacterium sp.]
MPKLIPEYQELIKSKIIQASILVFSENGLQESTMDEIAEKAGLSKPTLYSYFENKDDIIKTAVTKSVKNGSYPKTLKESDSLDALNDLYDMMINRKLSLPLGFEILAFSSKDDILRKLYRDSYYVKIEGFEIFLQNQQDKGTIKNDIDAKTQAKLLMALVNDISIQLLLQLDENEIRENWLNSLKEIL